MKFLSAIAVLGLAVAAAPATSDNPSPHKRIAKQQNESTMLESALVPGGLLVAGLVLVAVANRRRRPEKVIC